MKKNNKKGFFLSETMVVIAIVAVVLLGVFKLFNSVYFSFMQSETYNTANAINALSNIQKYYESKGSIDTSIIGEDVSYVNLTNLEEFNSDYYDRLKAEFKIDGIYLIDLNKMYTSNAINDFYLSFRKYLNTLKNVQGIVLVVALNENEYAYTEIENYQTVTLIGNPEDEFAVYIPMGGEFVEPGYKNWEGEEPIVTWENDTEVDTSKAGTYYKYYDFNGYLLRRKIVVGNHTLSKYVDNLESLEESEEEVYNNGIYNPIATYEGEDYDTGIRYKGSNPNNYVYFNCEDKDSNDVSYDTETYNYASSCEIWRIIGVFDVSNGTTTEKRVKLINTASTFSASWDSSASDINGGVGINQWGESTYSDGTTYEGADIMRLLNGYYIGGSNICAYCNNWKQEICSKTCDTEDNTLASQNIKPLTIKSRSMIENVRWNTYGVKNNNEYLTINNVEVAYLEENGISNSYTGKMCTSSDLCNDSVERTTSWTGLVGLMSASDIVYADGWLYNRTGSSLYLWTITPRADSGYASGVYDAAAGLAKSHNAGGQYGVFASVYLKSDIEIVSGSGTSTSPYIIK